MKILSDVMDLLFSEDAGPTLSDITEIMLSILRTVIQSTIAMDRDSALIVIITSVIIIIIRFIIPGRIIIKKHL